jgi:predicted nucleic acid-binding protein
LPRWTAWRGRRAPSRAARVRLDRSADRASGGAARLDRHRTGGKLGLGDALIAAMAKSLDATIVTRYRPDFERQGAAVLTY